MTIGDVLAFIAALFLVGSTWTATILVTALAFPAKATRAQEILIAAPGACAARGAVIFLITGLFALALTHGPAGPLRLVGIAIYAFLLALAAVGSAGIARLMGERIQAAGTRMSPFAALTRGTILYALAGWLPVIGWFFAAPAALFLSIGSAAAALKRSPKKTAPVTVQTLGQAEPVS